MPTMVMPEGAPIASPYARPAAPDSHLLHRAAVTLAGSETTAQGVTSEVGPRIDRQTSTVFPLTFHVGRRPVRAFFKTLYVAPSAPKQARERIERRIYELELASWLTPRASRALADLPVQIEMPLAVEPPSLSIITLAMPGEPLARVLPRLPPLRNRDRQRISALHTLLGVTLRRLDETTGPLIEGDHRALLLDAVEWLLSRRGHRFDDELVASLRRHFERLADRLPPDCAALCHGDLNSTNVFVRDGSLGYRRELDGEASGF